VFTLAIGEITMPGDASSDKSVTKHISEIQELQEEVSKWHSHLGGVHEGNDFEQLISGLTGFDHLGILGMFKLSKEDPTSEKSHFTRAVNDLNTSLFGLHQPAQNSILMKATWDDQKKGVMKYGSDAKKAVDVWKGYSL
jgi:hypothetical protein